MQVIKAPINPTNTGSDVQNLQSGLIALLDHHIILSFQPPDRPGEEEIIKLREALTAEYQAAFFGDGTRQLVLYFQLQQGLGDQFNGAVEDTTANKLNEILIAAGVLKNDSDKFIVKGFIRNHKGESVQALVKVYDQDLHSVELLGETNTDTSGYYELAYGTDNFKNAEKDNADVVIEVLDKNGQRLVISDVFYNALAVQEVNLTLPIPPSPPEWELLNEQILPLLTGQLIKNPPNGSSTNHQDFKPELLVESDFAFINNETGIDTDLLHLWSLAYLAGSEETRISPEIFYGWFRMSLPTKIGELFAISWNDDKPLLENIPENFTGILNEAVAKKIISNAVIPSDLYRQLYSIMAEHLIAKSQNGAPASIGDLLDIAGLSDDTEKMQIAEAIRKNRESYAGTDAFYVMLLGINVRSETKILFPKIFVLDFLTKHYLPLIQMLFASIPNPAPNPGTQYYPFVDPFVYTDFSKGIKNDIKALSLNGLELVKKVGAPIYFEGADQTEKELNYANYLDSILNSP